MSTQPLAMKVVATPIPVASAKSRSCLLARFRIAPLPAMMIGRRAAWISPQASSTTLSSGTGRRTRRAGSGTCSSPTSASARSSASSMWQAPGFSAVASLNALRTTSGMLSGCQTACAHLVTGLNMLTTSMAWWLSLWSLLLSACPVMTTIGARSMFESATPVIRLVAPGPSVPRQTPASPVSRPCTSAMNAAACSCRHSTNWIFPESWSEIIKSAFSSPGSPKMRFTPSFSRHFTNRSDAFTGVSRRKGWGGAALHHAAGEHGVGDLQEPGDVGALHVVHLLAARAAVLHAALVDAAHDVAQLLVELLLGPGEPHAVLRHLEARHRDAARVGRLAGRVGDLGLEEGADAVG